MSIKGVDSQPAAVPPEAVDADEYEAVEVDESIPADKLKDLEERLKNAEKGLNDRQMWDTGNGGWSR